MLLNLGIIIIAIIAGVLPAFLSYNFTMISEWFFIPIAFSIPLFAGSLVSKRNILQIVLMSLLILAIFFSPTFGSLRLQDFLLVLCVLAWIFTKKIKGYGAIFSSKYIAQLRNMILFFLGFSLVINMVHILFGSLPINPSAIFYLKEIQYFVLFGFILFNHERSDFMLKLFVVSMSIQVLWGLGQIVSGNHLGYYGIGLLGEGGPSQSGVFYFMSFALSLGYLLYSFIHKEKANKRWFYFFASLACLLCVLGTVSRTSIMAAGATIALFLIFVLIKWPWYTFFITFLSSLTGTIGYTVLMNRQGSSTLITSVINRFTRFGTGSSVRMNKWERDIGLIMDYGPGWLVGMGTAVHNVILGFSTLAADSQYLRIIYEKGIIGLVIWIFLIVTLFQVIHKQKSYLGGLYYAWIFMITGLLVTGVTHEVFYVVKVSEVFWLFTGICIGLGFKRSAMQEAVH